MTIPKSFRPTSTVVALCVLMTFASGQAAAPEDRAKELLRQMSAEIAGLDEFVITGDGYVDARLSAGQIIEHSMDVTLRMSRPDAMRITNVDAKATKEIYFGDGVLTVYDQARKFYAQRDVPAGVDAAAEYAVEELSIGRMHKRGGPGEMFIAIPGEHFRYIIELIENFRLDPEK